MSKAFGEDLASFYADKYGVEIACLRIGTARPDPIDPRHLSTWQSYEDLLRMIKACFAPRDWAAPSSMAYPTTIAAGGAMSAPRTSTIAPRTMPSGLPQHSIPDGDRRDPEAPEVKYQGGPSSSEGYVKRPASRQTAVRAGR